MGFHAIHCGVVAQIALYQITPPTLMTDPVTNLYSFGGEQRNRGLELAAYGEVQRGLRLMASAAFNETRLGQDAAWREPRQRFPWCA